ncbi:hypothetical protein ELI13_28630 (plasmid) [Rhizobium ruizarguesonis]|jgi:hypothetical protein|uniref:Uncharacterized protein n=1 Tax=Rhizobium ruizarguesonis TaxID=2081791 RepID=A0ABY1WYT8_9HYPH|nr:hypothetical protein [Rhizobium ruizarguesonis]TCA31170.1 hypothetical protein E0H70_14090 [Rhizobium leguminosarum bv. viciae]TAU15386.1 hypothetical protein ELI48_33185 [Rhizobium ruizarguesonis]TAU58712.1 hypothetical protein ELI45_34400 [Rhizobium ruizarguesonis]TAU61200.1 hypothetical protein ELI46_31580 [Rhizobium ruizarguesonis]TAV02917.1 hypothetical protein ELI34_31250 [Rhizobium ruizarguesonis]
MLPEIKLQGDVDVAALSPLLRGMILSASYADSQGGIGLTATGAMNRKFVHWAAVHFQWPDYTSEDLYSMNKVLNEGDMPPLWVVRSMLAHLKLLRKKKDLLLPTKRCREFLARPQAYFDLIATDYLYSYIHDGQTLEEVRERMRSWHVFLNLINIKARPGCSVNDLLSVLYPSLLSQPEAAMSAEVWTLGSELRYGVIRPLCWLGLLHEDRDGLTILQNGMYHKTPLWAACLQLESDIKGDILMH